MSDEKDKPAFDEQLLTTLLEAAYVLQEHNRELQAMELRVEPKDLEAAQRETSLPAPAEAESASGPAPKDYTFTLGQIVETQHQIQVRQLDLASALSLVAERLAEIGRAAGAAVGVLDGRKVRYKAAIGSMTLPLGTEVAMEKSLCVACLRTGQVIRAADVDTEFLLDIEECHRRGIKSMIAVPVYHDGGIAGGIELYYDGNQTFNEQDVHTCQLMAGLVTEALARDEELSWKKSLAQERAAMMEAMEQLRPQAASSATAKIEATRIWNGNSAASTVCAICGDELMPDEQFCGKCGSPRSSNSTPTGAPASPPQPEYAAVHTLQAPLPELPQPNPLAAEPLTTAANSSALSELETAVASAQNREELGLVAADLAQDDRAQDDPAQSQIRILPQPGSEESEEARQTELAKPNLGAWTSAASTRAFLEQLAPARRGNALARFWNARRADLYLAIAVILVACVIRWGLWPDGSVSATGSPNSATAAARKPSPDADLSLFDRMLISLGLAEAPEAEESKGGNPDAPVWVDMHTALYYCVGSDLYGKTPKGKFTTQREAQMDQFEPAARKACE